MRTLRRRTLVSAAVALLGAALVTVGVTHLRNPAPRPAEHAFGAVPLSPAVDRPASPLSTARTGRVPPTRTTTGNAGDGVPLRVHISRLKVDAPVVPVAAAGAVIDVPAAPATLGWWTGSAPPGSQVGTTVIVGHVDSAKRGTGALFHLDRVRGGDTIDVAVTGGRTQHYRVVALRSIAKSTGLSARELGGDGAPQLTLITCGGPFDRRTASYADNIVAYAEPVARRSPSADR